MASWYRVLQYYPNLVNGERINIAVVAYDETECHARVLVDWSRASAFSHHEDMSFTEENAHALEAWTVDQARAYESSAMSCTQLTKPRASLLTAAKLIERIAGTMLVEPRST